MDASTQPDPSDDVDDAPSVATERDLAAARSIGPPTDFEALYRDAYVPMLRLAVAIVDVPADAEQIVQDAFVALFRRWDRVATPGAYLRTSVVNGGRQMLRRREVSRRFSFRSEPVDLGFDHVRDAVRRLPPSQRVLVALRYEQQLTDSEIATEVGLPIGTVKSRLHRALARLREEIS